ncbi:cobyrinate a,c-diamide synthase [Aliiruegeria lutimaris]|uniref:Hydrogenobyrinate a,c-diamide synthase n=1 Tax=Aliiruegeria lutimaris TaxID=571298 RepID=A0A1G8WZU3_9RHOB|nr:cobyrinate a,c-diamide synthase [Aliiruegeria lutimaris]SDJ83879.1 cobyrinic acid a,c-diamide synthase [Aliiruegeria lutimaris]
MSARGFVIAAATSGAGKTTLTLGLLRALKRRGLDVRAAKSGPDYIDPAFHAAACGAPSVNLDAWAMPPNALRARAAAQGGEILVVEGAMGVLDAGRDGKGSAADLAQALGLPIVLVLDIAKAGQSALLPAIGLQALRPELPLAGVILNRAGTRSHAEMARAPLEEAGTDVFGALLRDSTLHLPERHLGLVQAGETEGLDAFLDHAAEIVEKSLDLDALLQAAGPLIPPEQDFPRLAPLGHRIAVASDAAFAFGYPHLLADWHAQGAQILPFSPLDNKGPDPLADAVYLPGGYPELFAGQLAAAGKFLARTRQAAERGARIYGECGGFMALGNGLIDADGKRHEMLGLLPLATSFQKRRLTLGYRRLTPLPGAPWKGALRGHEFHYATILQEGAAERLFIATDAAGTPLRDMGLRVGKVAGSYAHVIGPG